MKKSKTMPVQFGENSFGSDSLLTLVKGAVTLCT
jgi:hypothetical protein